jgi:phage terminase large subunit GpA-like protein
MNLRDGYVAVCQAVAQAWAPRIRGTVSEWAAANRVLPKKSASEAGNWRNERTPYLVEIMDKLSADDPAEFVSFMAASQIGKTEVLLNWTGYVIDQDPAPMLLVTATQLVATKYSKQRLNPMIAMSPRLSAKLPPNRSRDSGNNLLVKDYADGMLIMAGSNSAAELASTPIRYVALDETDRYPSDVGDEGDPTELAEQRTATFTRRKIFKCSTPGRSESSHIKRAYEAGSMAKWYMPCPHCSAEQVWGRDNLRWPKTENPNSKVKKHHTERAVMVCAECGAEVQERLKSGMLAKGKWVHAKPELARRFPSYHIAGYSSPVGLGRPWSEIARKWVEASEDASKLQAFINLIDGQPYEDHSDRVKYEDVQLREEINLEQRVVPEGYSLVTQGVDMQKDRFAFHTVAWGCPERSITIDYYEVHCDPSKEESWACVTEARNKLLMHACGSPIKIEMQAIDTGGTKSEQGLSYTQMAYRYTREFRHDRCIAIKGVPGNKPVLGKPSKQDIKNARGAVAKNSALLWLVGVDVAKSTLLARLAGDMDEFGKTPVPVEERLIRFVGGLGEEFYKGLVSEVFDPAKGKWVRLYRYNEPLDTWGYAYAAAHYPGININKMNAADWMRRDPTSPPHSQPVKVELEKPEVQAESARQADNYLPDSDTFWK